MNTVLFAAVAALLMVATVLALAWLTRRIKRGKTYRFANAELGPGTHEAGVTFLTDAAITTRHLLYCVGSDGYHIKVCPLISDLPMGTIADEASAAELRVTVDLLGKGSTKKMIANEAITVGEEVFTSSAGKVTDRPTGSGTYWFVGVALTAAAADGDVLEVADSAPVKLVI